MRYLSLLIVFLLIAGCETYTSSGRLHHTPEYQEREILAHSLIKDEKAILSEEAIQKILTSKIMIPKPAKLAIFRFEHQSTSLRRYYGFRYAVDSEFIQNSKEYLKTFEEPLWKTKHFSEITILPKMLFSEGVSLTRMREVAALMQADLLLVYKTNSFVVTTTGLFVRDRAKAYSSAEILLLDIRTGIIPYTYVFDEIHTEKRISDEKIIEMERRAEKEATIIVLKKAAEGLVKFFSSPHEK